MSEETSNLILGKYKDVDALETAYKSLQNQYEGLAQTKNQFTVPDTYEVSEQFKLVDSKIVESATNSAKKYGYTQKQFEENINTRLIKENEAKNSREEFDKKYGDEVETLSSFMKEEMGINSDILHKLSDDDINNIRKNRENTLKTSTKIGSNGISGMSVNKNDVHTIYIEMNEARNRGDSASFEYFLNRYKEISAKVNG